MKRFGSAALLLAAAACTSMPDESQNGKRVGAPVQAPTVQRALGVNVPLPSGPGPMVSAPSITPDNFSYHGGDLVRTPQVVAIYWSPTPIYNGQPAPGTFGPASQDGSLIGDFLRNYGSSSYWGITRQYYDGDGHRVEPLIYTAYWADEDVEDRDPTGRYDVSGEIMRGIWTGKIPYSPRMIYAVFGPPGVDLGQAYALGACAYHDWTFQQYVDRWYLFEYAVLPYNSGVMGCDYFPAPDPTPNNDRGADVEVQSLAHELAEAATDPGGNAWHDDSDHRWENADLCRGVTTPRLPDDNLSNVVVGSHHYRIDALLRNVSPLDCAFEAVDSVTVSPTAPTATIGSYSPHMTGTCVPGWPCPLTWSSSNPSIATVSSTGVVSGVAPGTATISACSFFKCGSQPVTVVQGFTVTITGASRMPPGGNCIYYASASGGVGPYTYQWTFSPPIVGYSPSNGVFSAYAESSSGSSNLTVTATGADGGIKSATKTITIDYYTNDCSSY